MKYTIPILLALFLFSCVEKKEATNIPEAPVSVENIYKTITGKKYAASQLALAFPLELEDKPSYDWMEDMKDTTDFFKKYYAERIKFSLSFQNDSVAILFDDNKSINGIYKIDNERKDEEKEGFKLRISYADSSLTFPGVSEPMIMTSTFVIAGIDETTLFLGLPREYNKRKVFALLKKE